MFSSLQIHEKKLTMNKWIVSLRDLKVAIIEEIQCVVQELKAIQSSLDPSKHLPIPSVPQLLPEETPEKHFQYDHDILLKFKQEAEDQEKFKKIASSIPSIESGSLGGFGGGFLHSPSIKEVESGRIATLRPRRLPSGVSEQPPKIFEIQQAESTDLELEIRQREEIRNVHLQETLIKRVRSSFEDIIREIFLPVSIFLFLLIKILQ